MTTHIPFQNCPEPPVDDCSAWFCVRSQPKHEHIAAAHLARLANLQIFHPRVRFVRSTRRGPVTFTESLFPNYLFARFNWQTCLNLVQHSSGVSEVVHFGKDWPTIPDGLIDELRTLFGENEIRQIPSAPAVGDPVLISTGVFEGLEAVVTRVMPGGQRVAVLLHFLGRQSTVELRTADLVQNRREDFAKKLCLESTLS